MKREILFQSRFNYLYVLLLSVAAILAWSAGLKTTSVASIFWGFIFLAFVFTGMQFRFYEKGVLRYYILPSLGQYCSYDHIHSIEFRDLAGPYQTPRIVIHLTPESESSKNIMFRSFIVRRGNVGEVKRIAEEHTIRWFESFD